MKYLISDYKPAPSLFLPLTQYICVIFCLYHFFDQIGYKLVISTKFLFFLPLTPYICVILFYMSFWHYKVYISNQY